MLELGSEIQGLLNCTENSQSVKVIALVRETVVLPSGILRGKDNPTEWK